MIGSTWNLAVLLLWLGALRNSGGASIRHGRSLRSLQERPRLKIITTQMEPFVRMKFSPGVIGNDRYEGYFVDVIRRLATELNFDYQLQLVADGKVGRFTEDEGWNGMIGELKRGSADLALGPIIVTPDRQAVVDFTLPINEVHATIIVAKPRQGSPLTIATVEDLLHQRELTYGVIRGSDAETAIKTSTDMKYRTLWNSIRMNYMSNTVENMNEGLERVRREKFALIMNAPAAEYHVRQSPCDLVTVGTFLKGRQYAFATQKGSVLTGSLDGAIRRLQSEFSDWTRLQEHWWMSNCPGMPSFTELNTGTMQSLNGAEEFSLQPTTPKPVRRLRITTFLKAPYVMRSPGGFHGYIVELLDRLAAVVPFEYSLALVKDGGKFGKRKRGQWNGMIGELIRGEADLAAAPFVHHRKHAALLDYTKPFLHSTFSMLIRVPRAGEDLPIYMTEDLLNSTDIEFGVVRKSLTEKQLRSSKEPLYAQLWKKMKTWKGRNVFNNLEDGLRRVRQGKFALLLESTDGAYVSSKPPCDLMLMDEFLSVTNYMFALRKGNPLAGDLNDALMVLQQDSVLQMLYHRWLNNDECLGVTVPVELPIRSEAPPGGENRDLIDTEPSSSPLPPLESEESEEDAANPDVIPESDNIYSNLTSLQIAATANDTDSDNILVLSSTEIQTTTSSTTTPVTRVHHSVSTLPTRHPTRRHKNRGGRKRNRNRGRSTTPGLTGTTPLTPYIPIERHTPIASESATTTTIILPKATTTVRKVTTAPITTTTTTTTTDRPTWALREIDFNVFFSTPSSEDNDIIEDDYDEGFRYEERTSWNPFVDVQKTEKTTTTTTSTRGTTPRRTRPTRRARPGSTTRTTMLPTIINTADKPPDGPDKDKENRENEAKVKERNVSRNKAAQKSPTYRKAIICIVLFFMSFQ